MVLALDFCISVSSEGMVKSPKLISSSSDAGVFWVGHELGVVSVKVQNSCRSSISFIHISIAVRWEGRERLELIDNLDGIFII